MFGPTYETMSPESRPSSASIETPAVAASSVNRMSYWPSTRVDIQPMTSPSCAARHGARDRRQRCGAAGICSSLSSRGAEKPAKRTDVGADPVGPVDHDPAGGSR